MQKIFMLILSVILIFPLASCKKEKKKENDNRTHFTLTLTNGGIIRGELYPDVAPKTVENFKKLCDEHFYDGLIFHRVIEDYIVQGGGYDTGMNPKESEPIKGEFSKNGVNNKLSHKRGVLSMARTQKYDSAANQFFIVVKDSPSLDGHYAAFAKITEGLNYVDEIAESKTGIYKPYGMNNVPKKQFIIESLTVEE